MPSRCVIGIPSCCVQSCCELFYRLLVGGLGRSHISEALLGPTKIEKNMPLFVIGRGLARFCKQVQRLSIVVFVERLVTAEVQAGSRIREYFVRSLEISHPPKTKYFKPDGL